MTVPLVVIAMEAEAAPVRTALGLDGHGEPLHPAFPARLWAGADVAANESVEDIEILELASGFTCP